MAMRVGTIVCRRGRDRVRDRDRAGSAFLCAFGHWIDPATGPINAAFWVGAIHYLGRYKRGPTRD